MKKKWRGALSLFFVLVLMLQLTGVMASADNDSVSGEEALRLQVLVAVTGEDGNVSYMDPSDTELASAYSVSLYDDEQNALAFNENTRLSALTENDLRIVPPAGYRLSAAFLRGAALSGSSAPLALEADAPTSETSTGVFVKAESFVNKDGSFNTDRLSSAADESGAYTLVIVFDELDSEAEIEVTADGQSLSPAEDGSFTAPTLDTADTVKPFLGWELRYANGSSVSIDAGSSFRPYASCELVSRWAEIVTVSALDAEATAGDTLDSVTLHYSADESALPEELHVGNVSLSVADADATSLAVGSYTIHPSAQLLDENDAVVESENYVLRFVDATLTVNAAQSSGDSNGSTDNNGGNTDNTGNTGNNDNNSGNTDNNDDNGNSNGNTGNNSGNTDNTDGSLRAPTPLPAPSISNSGNWIYFSTDDLVFTVDHAYSSFQSVELDGAELVKDTDYTVEEGSTIVKLKPSKLGTLVPGSHSLTIKFSDGVSTGSFSISKRTLTLTGQDITKVYDGSAIDLETALAGKVGTSGLAAGHKVSAHFSLEQGGSPAVGKEVGSYDIVLDTASLKVLDASDADVTSAYMLAGSYKATLTITPSSATNIPLTITAKSQTWTYDGKPHTLAEYTLSAGLESGDTITVSFDSASTITNVGEAKNKIASYVIKDAGGNPVPTDKYKVTLVEGTLKVTPMTLTLTAVSDEKTYDGKALKNDNVKATALAEGQKFNTVKFSVIDSKGNLIKNGPVEVGTYTKKVTDVVIVDAHGNDVTANYDIKKVDGTLKVLQGDGSKNTKAPKTGDETNIVLWIVIPVLALAAIGALAFFLLRGKKKGGTKPADKQ